MKISAPKQGHFESGPNMTPLVDVVMVILIFFMLAGSFGSAEKYMVTTLPSVADSGPGPDGISERRPVRVEVRVNADGGVTLPHLAGGPAITDADAVLMPELKRKLAEYAAAGRSPDDVLVVIEPQADTSWDRLAPVYDAALRAGYKSVGFNAAD